MSLPECGPTPQLADRAGRTATNASVALGARAAIAIAALLVVPVAAAAEPDAGGVSGLPSGDDVARSVNARDDGQWASRTLVMELTDRSGRTRTRTARSYRRYFGDEKRSVLFFVEPNSIRDTAFLSYDYPEAGREDDQWIYLPAVRKSRRVAAADRGQSFLGTDFSYEDIKKETKLGISDYRWKILGEEAVDGRPCWQLEAIPVDDVTAGQLGYSRVLLRVDRAWKLPVFVEYWDLGSQLLKTVRMADVRDVQGIWTPHRVEARNPRTGHATVFTFDEVDYSVELDEGLFTERALRRGAP